MAKGEKGRRWKIIYKENWRGGQKEKRSKLKITKKCEKKENEGNKERKAIKSVNT